MFISNEESNGLKASKITKKIVIILLVLVQLTTLTSCGLFDNRTDVEKVQDAIDNTMDLLSSEVTYEIKIKDFTTDSSDIPAGLLDIINKIRIDVTHRYDREYIIYETIYDIKLQATTLLEMQVYFDEDICGVYIPQLYDQPLYYEIEKAIDESDDDSIEDVYDRLVELSLLDSISRDSTYSIFDYQEVIGDFFYDAVEEEVESAELRLDDGDYNCDIYNFSADTDDFGDFVVELLEILEEDDDLKETLVAISTASSGAMGDSIDSDYDSELDLSLTVESEDELDESINEIKDQFEQNSSDGEIEFDIFIDKNEVIRLTESNVELEMNFEGVTGMLELEIVATREVANMEIFFDGIDTKDGVDLLKLSDQELEAISDEMGDSLQALLFSQF